MELRWYAENQRLALVFGVNVVVVQCFDARGHS